MYPNTHFKDYTSRESRIGKGHMHHFDWRHFKGNVCVTCGKGDKTEGSDYFKKPILTPLYILLGTMVLAVIVTRLLANDIGI